VCAIEYRPDPHHDGPDIVFVAAASPYRGEEFYMNPLEILVHGLFAPGRHLSAPIHVRGAVCNAAWQRGHRLPFMFGRRHYLLCRRSDLDEVEIQVETKWGSCDQTIRAEDACPRCRNWGTRPTRGLRHLSQATCSF
jgi:hypothetical protein